MALKDGRKKHHQGNGQIKGPESETSLNKLEGGGNTFVFVIFCYYNLTIKYIQDFFFSLTFIKGLT